MKARVGGKDLLAALIAAALGAWGTAAFAAVNVTLDPAVRYQTIRGWGAASGTPAWASPLLREAVVREAVKELGLTRLRLELPSGNRSDTRAWEQTNDDWDPLHINWPAFNTATLDQRVTEMVLPFKQAVEANGEPFNLYVSPSFFDGGSSGAAPGWLLNNPGEYAEFALACLLYLKNAHGIEADYYCILNEAGNNNPFNGAVVAEMIRTLGPRLQAAGLSTRIQFPESVNAQVAWNNYVQKVQGDDDVWRYIGCLSYHLYGTNDPYRSQIGDLGTSLALPTAQTEFMDLTMNHLYDDLTLGRVSYWEIYGLGQCLQWNPSNTSFSRIRQYWNFRQVLHFVRPGAVRIGTASGDSNLRVLAFAHDGRMTVVLINGSGARTASIVNLPVGTYGICQSVGGNAYQELGVQVVTAPRGNAATGSLGVTVPANTVMTIYAHPGTNQPPVVTDFRATPDFLTLSGPGRIPPSTVSLSASATDPERDPLSYRWSVTSQPAGGSVSLSAPGSATTTATGLTITGEYVFTVAVNDGINTVTRTVVLNVHADNQPPFPFDIHNRLPVTVTLPTSNTQLRCAAVDLEGDPLTYRWSVLSQPVGAAALLATPTAAACQVTNMTIAGDYVFQIELSDPTHTVAQKLTVAVYPPNPSAPTISNAAAAPAALTLPVETTRLSATTSDPDGDALSHWWAVKSKPAGAAPTFSAQGSPNSDVAGLTVPGTYVFTLRVVDRTKLAQRDVTVTVSPAARATVMIRPDVRHQTILGWSGMPWYPKVSAQVRDAVLEEAVNDLGLTWVHWTVPSGNRSDTRAWEWTNDDADPTHIHWPAFGTGPVDQSVRTWVLPFKQRVEARGERFGLAITQTFHKGGSTGSAPDWLLKSPAEFAEYATSLLLYLKNNHGLQVNYYVICKDAGDSNDNPFEVAVVARMIKALGPRLRALGLSTTVLFPESHDANTSWQFIQAVREDGDLWPFVGMVGYHLYGGPARNTDRPKIRDFALAKGLPISHAGSDGVNLDTLYDDLTLGDVSYWSIVGLGGPGPGGAFNLHLDNTSFSRGTQYWQYRQVMHYVRPGAVRVEAVSDVPAIRPLAFVHQGRTTTVLLNNAPPRQPRSATLRNLPPGDYGVCRCVGAGPYEELGVRHVDADGVLDVDLPADSVLTVYPHPDRNLPPTVVAWKAEPTFLKTPASRVRLSAAAQDPELDRLSYSWSVTGQPPGAAVTLADPQAATTEASGLTVPGCYVFTIAVRGGVNEAKREVRLNVYTGNQPPVLIDVHNRLPVQVTLPQSTTVLRGGALDLEGDKLTYRWSLVSQPPGAAVRLETPDDARCPVNNITVPGDHVFRFEAGDGTNTVSENLTVPVYPARLRE